MAEAGAVRDGPMMVLMILVALAVTSCTMAETRTGPITGEIYRAQPYLLFDGPGLAGTYSRNEDQYKKEVHLAEYLQAHPGSLTQGEVTGVLQQGQVWLGMDTDLATISWGRPDEVNRTVSASGEREQRVYTCQHGSTGFYYDVPCRYLYFENGKLTSWQD